MTNERGVDKKNPSHCLAITWFNGHVNMEGQPTWDHKECVQHCPSNAPH